ncbi:hypothetical protein V1264_019858 [Littorina saxatilis]|uniref:Uncharacterized protein n=1 Tax=Littorina saxatilis TaxID=31220 RepID=A0AAN9GAA2_9CAEN
MTPIPLISRSQNKHTSHTNHHTHAFTHTFHIINMRFIKWIGVYKMKDLTYMSCTFLVMEAIMYVNTDLSKISHGQGGIISLISLAYCPHGQVGIISLISLAYCPHGQGGIISLISLAYCPHGQGGHNLLN